MQAVQPIECQDSLTGCTACVLACHGVSWQQCVDIASILRIGFGSRGLSAAKQIAHQKHGIAIQVELDSHAALHGLVNECLSTASTEVTLCCTVASTTRMLAIAGLRQQAAGR